MKRLIVAVVALTLISEGALAHKLSRSGMVWNNGERCLENVSAITGYFAEVKAISRKDPYHFPADECNDYDAAPAGHLKMKVVLKKASKRSGSYRRCKTIGPFKNENTPEILSWTWDWSEHGVPCGNGWYKG